MPSILLVTPPAPDWACAPFPPLGPALLKGYLGNLGVELTCSDLTGLYRSEVPFQPRLAKAIRDIYSESIGLIDYLSGRNTPLETDQDFQATTDLAKIVARFAATAESGRFRLYDDRLTYKNSKRYRIIPRQRKEGLSEMFLDPELPFDELGGLSFERKLEKAEVKQLVMAKIFTRNTYLRQLGRIFPDAPLYLPMKKLIKPYSHFDIYL